MKNRWGWGGDCIITLSIILKTGSVGGYTDVLLSASGKQFAKRNGFSLP